jgi:hypothetical protein
MVNPTSLATGFIIYFALLKITKRDDLLPAPVFFEKKPEGGNN